MGPLENRAQLSGKVLRLKFDFWSVATTFVPCHVGGEEKHKSRCEPGEKGKEVDAKWQQLFQGSSLGDISSCERLSLTLQPESFVFPQ